MKSKNTAKKTVSKQNERKSASKSAKMTMQEMIEKVDASKKVNPNIALIFLLYAIDKSNEGAYRYEKDKELL